MNSIAPLPLQAPWVWRGAGLDPGQTGVWQLDPKM